MVSSIGCAWLPSVTPGAARLLGRNDTPDRSVEAAECPRKVAKSPIPKQWAMAHKRETVVNSPRETLTTGLECDTWLAQV